MRATDFLTESQQQEYDILVEGPLGRLGQGIGKLAGGVAKGVGAVAGGVAGLGRAFKKGYVSGRATVAGDPEPTTEPAANVAQPAAGKPVAPAATGSDTGDSAEKAQPAAGKPAADANATPKPTATATATNTTTVTQPAADPNATPKPTAVAAPADDAAASPKPAAPAEPAASTAKETDYAKAMKFVKGLPIAKQKDIIAMLQRDPKVAAAMKAPAATKPVQGKPAAGAEQPAADAAAEKPAGMPAGRFGQEMGRLATPLAGADSETPGAALPQKTAGNTAQQDLKAKLKAGGGLAKTSGTGFKQGIVKGNMRLGAGRGGVSMSHVPDGNPLIENKKFSLFRKQR